MVGITFSPEQIYRAPPEVRHWLEEQIAGALGLSRPEPAMEGPPRQLASCSVEEARAVLSLIYSFLPVVAVFFELGREPAAASAQGLRALRVDELQKHARLQTNDQLLACLQAIDEALQQWRGDREVVVTTLDGQGHCLVADTTSRSILALWQEIVADRAPAPPGVSPTEAAPRATFSPQAPYRISVPTFSVPQDAGNAVV